MKWTVTYFDECGDEQIIEMDSYTSALELFKAFKKNGTKVEKIK